jgi:hypothetical protein
MVANSTPQCAEATLTSAVRVDALRDRVDALEKRIDRP